jgi:hypothetical protein
MNRPEIVHIAPKNEAWRVYRAGYDTELSFEDLGQALDAASAMATAGGSVRIVIHENPATKELDTGAPGISSAA